MIIKVRINTLDKVKDFVNIVSKYSSEADLSCERYTVDAKSILGILSLNLIKDLTLTLKGSDNLENENMLNNLESFLI
jgi:Phosphotransferase system, HPr-related proteins